MDSGNSGSFQSSSGGGGGDDEYDSRTQVPIPSFVNPASTYFNPNPNPLLQPPSSHHQPPPTFFNPSSTSSFSHSPNPDPNQLYDIESVWSRNIRSDQNFAGADSARTQISMNSRQGSYPNPSMMDSNKNPGRGSDHHPVGVTVKNPKKRTRASRRAPTTVLTTDTTNFRQMVQEFTGFPDTPFSAASSSPFSGRLDLFGRGAGAGIGPLYPLRPSAQRIIPQQPSLLNSTPNIIDSGNSNNINTATTTTEEASSDNYQIPPSNIQGIPKQPQSFLNLQSFRNPMFPLQSLLQTTISQQANGPILGTTKSDNLHSDFLSGFPSSSTRWRGQDENFGGFEGENGNTRSIGGYKLNSSDFHQTENVVSSRSGGDQVQGNVDSWICPSD